ncbi:MAG: hypothetical protein JWN17_637 [Frankiales bacterium]|nr:hypothetical protein [Frankiales bacterium]
MSNTSRVTRLRAALAAAALLCVSVPALASAAPTDCADESGLDAALCVAVEGGRAVQSAESPLVGPRDTATAAGDAALELAGVCDPTDSAACLLPFPNDRYTVADPTTVTGRRLALSPLAMPRNASGRPIDPTELNRNDGFSPGSAILTSVPGLDLARTGVAPITDMGASLRKDAPVVLLDATTGRRAPYLGELDTNPTDGEQPLLIVRPATNLTEGHRYVVGLRGMKDAAGKAIAPDPEFVAERASAKADDPVFAPLAKEGVAKDDLFLAWGFTVASTQSITGRMLHIRDDAFASLKGGVPAFTVDATTPTPNDTTLRRVTGSFTVPSYLLPPVNGKDPVLGADVGLPGTRFAYLDGDDLPDRTGDFTATFTCNIPKAALSAPARGSIYGHGLLGGQGEVDAGNVTKMAAENDITFCATDWYGMATGDVPNVASMLADMSNFPTLPDRVQQGMLAHLFLARLLKDPRGFATDPAFQDSGRPLLKTGEVYYDGNSQGGIIGGALVAVSQDITRGVLGVPGMNYSTLLDRSTDFATYESVLNASYPSERDRELVFGLIQGLWDRAENDGYASHLRAGNELPGTPAHRVLLHPAYGDHQVANVSAEVMARTIGARTNEGFLAPGRHWGSDTPFGITRFDGSWAGNALVYWDSGTATAPLGNTPAVNGPGIAGHDPHEDPRATYLARVQKGLFLHQGSVVTDVCGGQPCLGRNADRPALNDPPNG